MSNIILSEINKLASKKENSFKFKKILINFIKKKLPFKVNEEEFLKNQKFYI